MPKATLPIAAAAIAAAIACSEPPSKEIDRAQGALDAARAAGADLYARQEYDAARGALTRAEEAVGARDYRLALAHALDARERAQDAARAAADRKAASRSAAERTLAEAEAALLRARTRLAALATARPRRRDLADEIAGVEAVSRALQESRTALSKEDYLGANKALEGVLAKLDAILRSIAPPARPRGGRAR